jgi:hypothetical protein
MSVNRKLFFNIHGNSLRNPSKAIDVTRKVKPNWALVMDNLDLAEQLKIASPTTNVIFRAWPDDGLHSWISADDWARESKARIGGADVWVYAGNEPGWSAYVVRHTAKTMRVQSHKLQAARASIQNTDNLKARFAHWLLGVYLWFINFIGLRFEAAAVKSSVRWATEVIPACRRYGLKVVVLNLSGGTPSPDAWKEPAAQDLLRLLDTNRDMAVIGLHEYACAVITSGFIGGYPQYILPDSWPKDVSDLTMWHCGRYRFLIRACESLGIKPPRIVITEFGFDDMSDIKGYTDMLPRTPPYTSIRGWRSLVEAWKQLYSSTGWTALDTLFNSYKYAATVIYPAVEGALIFSRGASSALWTQFDCEDDEFDNRLIAFANEDVVIPPAPPTTPAPGRYRVEFRDANGNPRPTREINLRLTANGTITGTVKHGDVIAILPGQPERNGDYWWLHVDFAGVMGWIALVSDIRFEPAPVTPPVPDFEKATEELRAIFGKFMDAFNAASEDLLDWKLKYL